MSREGKTYPAVQVPAPFTDRDLKRWKDMGIVTGSLANLVNRLKAAERKFRALELHHDADNDGDCFKDCLSCKEITNADIAWRKAAGK